MVILSLLTSLAFAAENGIQRVPVEQYCAGLDRQACFERANAAGSLSFGESDEGEYFTFPSDDYESWIAAKLDFYNDRVTEVFGLELTPEQAWRDAEARRAEGKEVAPEGDWFIKPLSCTEDGNTTDETPDGAGGCKLIFGSDNRALQSASTARTYPMSKHVAVIRSRFVDSGAGYPLCSGTFVDAFHVLTAAHCVYDTDNNNYMWANPAGSSMQPTTLETPYGSDGGRGYVCLGGEAADITEFSENCEMIVGRNILTGYGMEATSASLSALELDVALLTLDNENFPSGLGQGRWMAMSSITSASALEALTSVSYGYPGTRPTSSSNSFFHSASAGYPHNYIWMTSDEYKTTGSVDSPTTSERLMTKLEAAGGQSGSGIFYYTDGNTVYSGQGHYIISVLSSSVVGNDGTTANDYTAGPTVGQFKDWVVGQLP